MNVILLLIVRLICIRIKLRVLVVCVYMDLGGVEEGKEKDFPTMPSNSSISHTFSIHTTYIIIL